MTPPELDLDDGIRILLDLLETPSPTGLTDAAVRSVESELARFGVPSRRTRKGALLWTLPGSGGRTRAVASHIDTLGAVVKGIKENGRLKLSSVGGYDWATIEGAECLVHTDDGRRYGGTVVNMKQSSHVFGQELRELKRDASVLEVRLDEVVTGPEEIKALGIEVGDLISFTSAARYTQSGFIKGRHLDNKAGVAVSLMLTKAFAASGAKPDGDTHFFVSNYEEVGHGAAFGVPPEAEELLCIDMAAVGEGQTSTEYDVTLCVKDSGGPYDRGMNRRLKRLALEHDIPLRVDVYPFYSSDATAAWLAGADLRAALIGPGVDASHAYERTHRRALEGTARLAWAYLTTPIEAQPA